MSRETISYTENNFDPLNKAIDESIREQRARIAWQYAKITALILVSIGILAILLAWAFNIYKKPNPDLVNKINEVDKRFSQSQKIDDEQEKIIDGKTIKYNRKTHVFDNVIIDGYEIVSRYKFDKTKDLLEGTKTPQTTCYITNQNTKFEFDNPATSQQEALKILNLTYDKVLSYKKYCDYSF